MKLITFFCIFALSCAFAMQTEAFSRVRRQEESQGMDQIQKKLSDTFDSFKKAAEDVASKMDLKRLQEDFTTRLDQLAKSFSDFTSPQDKKPEATEAPAAAPEATAATP